MDSLVVANGDSDLDDEDDWQRINSLFDSNWYGPCDCLQGGWGSSQPAVRRGAPLSGAAGAATHSAAVSPATPPAVAAAFPSRSGLSFRAFLPTLPAAGDAQPEPRPNLLGAAKHGRAAAESPFAAAAVDASPPKAVPVPRRMPGADQGGDGPLPAPVPIEPQQGEPAHPGAQHASAADAAAAAGPYGDLSSSSDPQLGTWADRQYRLLEAVPERCEAGGGSGSANSGPSSSSACRSPAGPALTVSGGAGSGETGSYGTGGGSGSGGTTGRVAAAAAAVTAAQAGGGGESIAAQVAGGPTLLEILQHQQQQLLANGHNGGGAARADAPAPGPFQLLAQQQQPEQRPPPPRREYDEGAVQDAAWRWRFTRRWQAEQARTAAGPSRTSSAATDQLEEALAYLNATGATATTTVSMQIGSVSAAHGGRNGHRRGSGLGGAGGEMSLEGAGGSGAALCQSLVGTTLGGGGLSSTLGGGDWPLGGSASGSGSFTSGPRLLRRASGEMLAASREVASLNRRAAVALQQQMDCEHEADRRVAESLSQGSPWVGAFLPMVCVEEWGSFRFLMLKLRDQAARLAPGLDGGGHAGGCDRQRILLRGRNYGSEGQLMEECTREILALAQKHGVPFEAPTVMGGGVMEWRRDRDRHLHLHSGFVVDRALPAAGGGAPSGRPGSALDLLNLAAALARQSFPPTYKVTVLL